MAVLTAGDGQAVGREFHRGDEAVGREFHRGVLGRFRAHVVG